MCFLGDFYENKNANVSFTLAFLIKYFCKNYFTVSCAGADVTGAV